MPAALKSVLLNAVAVGLVVVAVLWSYEYFVAQPRELRRTEQLQEQARVAAERTMDRRLNEAQDVGVALQASVDRSIAQVRQGVADETRLLELRAQVAEGLVRASMHKVAIAESYMTMGQWPTSADEAGLPSPQSVASSAILGVSLRAAGTLEIAYAADFGKAAVIRLIPSAHPQSGQINWRCESSGFADASLVPSSCR